MRFSKVSGLKTNISKCDKEGKGGVKGANMAIYDMQCINLKKESLKILGIHYLCNKILEQEKSLKCNIS